MDTTATMHIINFIKGIGIKVDYETLDTATIAPGVSIKNGGIIVDPTKLKNRLDILQQAARIALTPKSKRKTLSDATAGLKQTPEDVAWQYAACKHLGIDNNIGVRNDELIEGISLLNAFGMLQSNTEAIAFPAEHFPPIISWLSQQQTNNDPLSEKDKMTSGEPYRSNDTELVKLRADVRKQLGVFNQVGVHKSDVQYSLLKQMLGDCGKNSWIEPPFYCDYGFNISMGQDSYMNFDCVILDVAPVTIGDNVMMGPKVQLLAATHVLDPVERNFSGTELGKPITIGHRAWLGAGVIVCPGVTIGDEAVIGAGSVVTRDIPARVFAAGNPCKVIKAI